VSLSLESFLHDFRQEILANAEANLDFLEAEFTQRFADELVDAGVTDGFEPCHYRPATGGGMRVDGYWFNDSSLDIFITDFANRETLQSLTQTEVTAIFKRAENFVAASLDKNLYTSLEETSRGYGLSRQIADSRKHFSKVSFYLISERVLSERLKALEDKAYDIFTFSYNIWDISRLHRQFTSRGAREELEISFVDVEGGGLPCLPAHLSSASYKSYLVVMPAGILAELYGRYGSRLLEQNVRSFLQSRGNVNKGIRTTILTDPEMFFAYNNGITATAHDVETSQTVNGVVITSLKDLQIVNGGQTTASLFHTQRKDDASLEHIFVQMKLTVIDDEKSEEVVPRISEYANTQNRVNAADFFSNHPYHIRMEGFSRRLWAPTSQGAQRETKWFYERARGQYADALSKLKPTEQKRFQAEFPKPQMMTKTDIAKFEGVWDDNPISVNLGAQKNFAHYAGRIGKEWDADENRFNEWYYKRLIARTIIFRATEKLVSAQEWYGGYRANIVAYTIAMLAHVCKTRREVFDFIKVWNGQNLSQSTVRALEVTAMLVHDDIMQSGNNISNISEWCKREACWERLQTHTSRLLAILPDKFFDELISEDDAKDNARSASKTQKVVNGIEAQQTVVDIDPATWSHILEEGQRKRLYTPKEVGILQVAVQMPSRLPSEKQCFVLLEILEKARAEAIWTG